MPWRHPAASTQQPSAFQAQRPDRPASSFSAPQHIRPLNGASFAPRDNAREMPGNNPLYTRAQVASTEKKTATLIHGKDGHFVHKAIRALLGEVPEI